MDLNNFTIYVRIIAQGEIKNMIEMINIAIGSFGVSLLLGWIFETLSKNGLETFHKVC